LQELYRVVLVIEPNSPANFGNWLDSLNQGASLEGVYRGFTRSTFQRDLEADGKTTAEPKTVGAFSQELADLLLDLKDVPEMTAEDARPLMAIAAPGEGSEEGRADQVFEKKALKESFQPFAKPTEGATSARPSREALVGKIGARFTGSSVYTMKRVLGDWALKVIDQRREESVERLRDWYADFASRLAKKGVDFGLALRNESSRTFHRQWADQASEDQIRWEVLNRVHRIMNHAQGLVLRSQTGTVATQPRASLASGAAGATASSSGSPSGATFSTETSVDPSVDSDESQRSLQFQGSQAKKR
jgi:hypothetical protein